jgi:hypothetical protein
VCGAGYLARDIVFHLGSSWITNTATAGCIAPPLSPWELLAAKGLDLTHPAPPCFDNSNRYVDCGNGTVTDTVTGLVWLKNAECFGELTYSAAGEAAAGLAAGQCGLTDGSSPGDWRLPTLAEWQATVARALALNCRAFVPGGIPPSLTNDPGTGCLGTGPTSFTGVQFVNPDSVYWTSNANESNPVLAFVVGLSSGFSTNHAKGFSPLHFVWPVRAGSR